MPYLSNWIELTRGRHVGKSLPQVVWVEPGYLFWLVENQVLGGMAGAEASRLAQLARAIRIPMAGTALLAECVVDRAGRFSSLDLVPAASPPSGSLRLDRLDLGVAHAMARPHRDLRGGELLVQSVKKILFGPGPVRMTRQRAERFFEDPSNFIAPAPTSVS